MELPVAELKKHLKILLRRKKLFIILSLCIVSAIFWGSYFLPKKYIAQSTVFIERNVINKLVEGIAITPSMEDRLRVLRQAMLSRNLVLKVIKNLDLDTKAGSQAALEEMIDGYQKKTDISIRGNDLFIVSVVDHDPSVAAKFVNTIVSKYIEENLTAKREEAYGAGRFLTEQMAALKEKIDKAESAVIKFRQDSGIILSEDEKSIVADIKNFRYQLDDLKVQQNESKASLNSLKKQLESVKPYTVSVLKHSNRNVAALEQRLSDLLIRYTEKYPEVIKLKAEIADIKKQQASDSRKNTDDSGVPEQSTTNPIYQELTQRIYETESLVEAGSARQKQLLALISAKEQQLKNIPENKRKLADLEQERDAQRNLYNQLLQRQGQSDVSKQMEVGDKTTTFRVVDPAVVPLTPFSPNRLKMFIMAIFMGLAGGFAGVLAAEGLDSRVRQDKTLKDLGLRILAVIPNIYNEDDEKRKVKQEKVLYFVAGSYLLVVCITMLLEYMGINYFEQIATRLSLGGLGLAGIKTAMGIF